MIYMGTVIVILLSVAGGTFLGVVLTALLMANQRGDGDE